MSNNYEDYGYEDKEEIQTDKKSALMKKIIIVILVVIAILIIFYLVKGCSGRNDIDDPQTPTFNYEQELLNAGKLYYENNMSLLPISVGECSEVKLEELIEKGLVNPDEFSTCNLTATYVRVCVLQDGSKQYTPWLVCTDKNSENEYGPSIEGTLNDIITDSTYVSFIYLPQMLKTEGTAYGKTEELWKDEITYENYKTLGTTNYYRYRDKLYTWDLTTNHYYTTSGEKTNAKDVNEYYVTSPNSDYKMYDNATNEAYKWYKNTSSKIYYLGENGEKAFSPTAPEGYPYNEGGIDVYFERSDTTYNPYKYYVCAVDATSTTVVYQQDTPCGQGTNKNFTYQRDIVYSCSNSKDDEGVSVIDGIVDQGDKCHIYGYWKSLGTGTCKISETCRTYTFYNWYKFESDGNRSYYPSGSKNASGEKVYYTSAPAAGYIKDETTRTKAYKWYRTTTKTSTEYTATAPSGYSKATKTNDYKWSNWSDWSTKNPSINDGRDRSIETKVKIKLQQIIGASEENWVDLTENSTYVTLDEMIEIFKNNKYEVNTLADINNIGEIRYQIKMMIRNKKETE